MIQTDQWVQAQEALVVQTAVKISWKDKSSPLYLQMFLCITSYITLNGGKRCWLISCVCSFPQEDLCLVYERWALKFSSHRFKKYVVGVDVETVTETTQILWRSMFHCLHIADIRMLSVYITFLHYPSFPGLPLPPLRSQVWLSFHQYTDFCGLPLIVWIWL